MDNKGGIEKTFEDYNRRLRELLWLHWDIVEDRRCALSQPDPIRQTNFERLVEGIAIQLALTWEIFTRDTLLDSILEYADEFNERFIKDPNWKPKQREDVEKIIVEKIMKIKKPNGYLSFGNTSHLKRKAAVWIDGKNRKKNPFLALDEGLLQALDRFTTLRNELVHRSSSSRKKFEKEFPGARSPGEYLKREINAAEKPQHYNQRYQLGYFIEVFKNSLYEMAKAKSIRLPPWPLESSLYSKRG